MAQERKRRKRRFEKWVPSHWVMTIAQLGGVNRWHAHWGGTGPGLTLEIVPWWCLILEWVCDRACRPLHHIPFPPIPFKDEDGRWTNLNEYYGDLGCVWDVNIGMWGHNCNWKFAKHYSIPVTEEMVNLFDHDTRIWWMQQTQTHKEWAAQEAADEARDKTEPGV